MNKENQNIEWKQTWRDEYIKWLCGFANAQGGLLVIGRNDEGEAMGVAHAKKLLEDIPNKVRDILDIERILSACQEANTPAPIIHTEANGVWIEFPFVELEGKMTNTTQETTQETVQETTREKILRLIRNNPAITRREMAEKIGMSSERRAL